MTCGDHKGGTHPFFDLYEPMWDIHPVNSVRDLQSQYSLAVLYIVPILGLYVVEHAVSSLVMGVTTTSTHFAMGMECCRQ